MGYHHLTELMSADAEDSVHIIAFDTEKQKGYKERVPKDYIKKHHAKYPYVNLSVKPLQAFLNLFSSESLNIIRFDREEIHQLLENQLQQYQYDVVFIESLFMMPYFKTIQKHHKGKIIYRSHNIEFKIWESLAYSERNYFKKWYLRLLSQRLKKYELKYSFLADGLTSVSLADIEFYHAYNNHCKTLYLPYSFRKFIPLKECINSKPSFYFIGGMDWEPNLKAVEFISKKIVPLLKQNNFKGKITIGGRKMPEEWKSNSDDILQFVGEIEDLDSFLAAQHVLISPLFTGGGLKIKIVEALAMGINVVTNSENLNSLPIQADQIAFLANDAVQFADHIMHIYANPDCLINKREAVSTMLNDYFLFEKNQKKLKNFIAEL